MVPVIAGLCVFAAIALTALLWILPRREWRECMVRSCGRHAKREFHGTIIDYTGGELGTYTVWRCRQHYLPSDKIVFALEPGAREQFNREYGAVWSK